MYEITLNIGGVAKSFKKDYINVADNMLAVEHQVRQSALYENAKSIYDPKQHRKLNEAYLAMLVEMYGNQFTVDDLKRADMSVLDTLNDLYLDALGGRKSEEDLEAEGDEKKE